MNEIDWNKIKITVLKYYEVLAHKLEHLNWTIIGAAVFLSFLIYYVYDSMEGSQVSGWFVLIVMFLLLAIGFASTLVVQTF